MVCFSCGLFGHDAERCPLKRAKEGGSGKQAVTVEQTTAGKTLPEKEVRKDTNRNYGEWMIAQPPRIGRRGVAKVGKGLNGQNIGDKTAEEKVSTSSRFEVLESEEAKNEGEVTERRERKPLVDISNVMESTKDNLEALSKSRNLAGDDGIGQRLRNEEATKSNKKAAMVEILEEETIGIERDILEKQRKNA